LIICKEEVIWNKRYISSPVLPLGRVHETIAIFSKGSGKINRTKVPYEKLKKYAFDKVENDVKRIASALNNPAELEVLQKFIKTRKIEFVREGKRKHNVTVNAGTTKEPATSAVYAINSILNGGLEKSIITELPNRINTVHPTQKPTNLFSRLINLISKEGDTIFDPFLGSGTCALACMETKRNFEGCEIDQEYYDVSWDRIRQKEKEQFSEINF